MLKTDGCYECTWGCFSPYTCSNDECPVHQAVHVLADIREAIDLFEQTVNGDYPMYTLTDEGREYAEKLMEGWGDCNQRIDCL